MKSTVAHRLRARHAVLPALLVLALLGGCGREPASYLEDASQVSAGQIQFPADSRQLDVLRSEAVSAGASASLQLPGRVAWDETRSSALHTPLPGQVARIEAQPGQKVKAGQVIAWITSPEFGQAQAEGTRGRAELQKARKELDRTRELHAAGVASGRELDEAEANFAGSQADHARAAAFAKAYGNGQRVDQRLPLRAPIDGVLVERRMSPGMSVSPDSDQPLAVIGDPDRLWVLLDVPESLAGRVKVGMGVSLHAADGAVVQSTLLHMDDFVDSERRVVQARAELDNRARGFKAGQYVRAQVALPAQGGVSLPDAAVLLIDGKQVVFVEEGKGRFVRHAVHAEELGDGRLWVREGLAAGSRVVVEGGLLLQQLVDNAPATVSTGTGHAAP
ncbi:efflux RND transporter periplasmic adaptor subunit [Stenotrophomonas maltophilia]|uniref:efflux RND transporter periplasmic adaptor subunit n=1 Tax=Stenotrophomonas maltophilia TaxID=40324 RepID=UPI0015DF07F7|nr:efflux RND transporter periplasmic adaptor subunit [Stenotrophomonas maltophilia]MBA0279561.1 efflux RND transporter periplasmic adaptor subunit [Stenotrophomonas maltophilia]MBA0343939.1 efflux RND transporter periplasmic adaptor subunit [Stenotrophomonas maltophilia]MBA0356573.1 efflux RND transporter periplasmic adaptor subunit [Stenotrophomonas maltophilia]MBA0518052.1 efflux RND transporter periplasmic adaptor subunit [Stenotrophomonas maltophilia]